MSTSASSKSAQRGLSVIKVGGSLLEWPELPRRLSVYLGRISAPCAHLGDRGTEPPPTKKSAAGEDPPGSPFALIAGGGPTADVIRTMDQIHGLGDERAHRLAIHALDLNARILASLLPGSVVVDRPEAIGPVCNRGQIAVLVPSRFLEEIDDRRPDPLPASWDVTSDSIAARIAAGLRAGRLVLLKSASLPLGAGRAEAARLGLVDPFFPSVARELETVEYVCLRELGSSPRILAI